MSPTKPADTDRAFQFNHFFDTPSYDDIPVLVDFEHPINDMNDRLVLDKKLSIETMRYDDHQNQVEVTRSNLEADAMDFEYARQEIQIDAPATY